MTNRFRILTVCSGNVCRSPFVELLLTQQLAPRPDFEVTSAGTIARPGMQMTEQMVGVAHAHGVAEQASRMHRATRLFEETVEGADLILGLTREHRAAAVQLVPSALRRTFTLVEFARAADAVLGPLDGGADREAAEWGPRAHLTPDALVAEAFAARAADPQRDPSQDDIDDPIGRSQATYDRVGDEIAQAVAATVRALFTTAPGGPRKSRNATNTGGPSLDFSFRPA